MQENCSDVTTNRKFHLLAFSKLVEMEYGVFSWIFILYLLILFGNIMITTLICLVNQLHTPMYFFLCNLAVQDIIYVSTTMPKLLSIMATGDTEISFAGCITQIFVFDCCVLTEFFLLVSMAYDRYVAICIPLHYSLIMKQRTCVLMASTSWITAGLDSFLFSLLISYLSFCNSSEINHFFCDPKTLLELSGSDTTHIRNIVLVEAVFLVSLPCVIFMSYVFIISTILKIRNLAGRLKAFSSCSSHITIVFLFFGTSCILYLKPESESSQEQDKFLSLLYVALVPMLNPIVYSFRNKKILLAVKMIFKSHILFKQEVY